MAYKTIWDFYDDTARLAAEGATLREIYDAMLTIDDREHGGFSDTDSSQAALRQLATHWSQTPRFVPIRLMELFGSARIEHNDDYVLALVGHLGGRHQQEIRVHMLRHDHDLRENVFWRVFEVEGGGEISLTNIDKFSRDDLNWHNTVLMLVNEGTLDRARVLRSCLEALNRDFSAYRSGWFSRVYAALAPTPAQSAAHQDLLLRCLGETRVTATVTLAVKQLAALHQAGLLDARAFLDACPLALGGPKAAMMTLLRILQAIAKRGEAPVHSVADVMVGALAHPHADVQRATIKALCAIGYDARVTEHRDTLAPAVVAEFSEVFAETGPSAVTQSISRQAAGNPSDAQADSTSELLFAGPSDVISTLVLAPAAPVQAWRDEDALERYAALLEDSSDAIEFELAMAWLAQTERAGEILQTLVKRARKIHDGDASSWAAALVLLAAQPDSEFLPRQYWQPTESKQIDGKWVSVPAGRRKALPTAEEASVLPSIVTRLREVAAILQGRAMRRSLLATPTDTHGWVDADTLLARFEAVRANFAAASQGKAFSKSQGVSPPRADLAQAILRVKPEHWGRVLAATQAEPPLLIKRVRIEWHSRGSDSRKPNGDPMWVWWDPRVHVETDGTASSTNPALVVSRMAKRVPMDLEIAELALLHPASTLPLVVAGVDILNNSLDEAEVEHRAGSTLAALARHPGVWTPETAQLVALGLSARRAEHRARAVELLAVAVPARISADDAAQGFAACAPACVLTRWASSLTDAALLNPSAVIDTLTALLPRLDRTAHGMGALLTVLLDETLRAGRVTTDAILREWLAGFKGSSAAAKAAKSLLYRGGIQ